MVTKQKPKPAPPRPLHSYVPKQQQPRPLPMQQQPLQPAPKATGGHYHALTAELTDAEAGDLLRRLVALDTDIRRYQQTIAEKRREQEMLLNQARLGIKSGIIEECSNCHGHHTGSCN